jgi:glycine/D-amino acid oxidase-like deaminating enzyme
MAPVPDILVVGGGVVGCAVAHELARRGLSVSLLERAGLCSGASGGNGALVWPQAMKRGLGLDFSLANARLFPALAEELGADIGYRRIGGMVAIGTDEQWASMVDYVAGQAAVGLPAELLDATEARRREPALGATVRGAVFAAHGGVVNPFRMTLGYARAARASGARLQAGAPVTGLVRRGDRIVGVATPEGPRAAGRVVLAAGSWSAALAATAGLRIPVVPRQGMMVVTEPASFRLHHVLKPIKSDRDPWAFSQPWPPDSAGTPGYDPNLPPGKGMGMAQTDAGNLLLGSTSRFVGLDLRPTPDGIRYILAHAASIVPALRELRVIRAWAGLRPHTPDGLPLLGPAPGVENLLLATGHDGSGINHAPVSARIVADLVTGSKPELPAEAFDPRRFGAS